MSDGRNAIADPVTARDRGIAGPLALLARHRGMLGRTAFHDIRARYAGSVLGLAWLVVYPLLFLGVYALVYVYIYQIRLGTLGDGEYVVLIFCGLVPFLGLSEALSTGVGSVASNANLIKNSLFPIDLIPVKSALTSQCTQAVGTLILLATLAAYGRLSAWALLLPVIWLAQLAFTIGVLWILSSLNVVLRDLQTFVPVLVMLLMLISPIAYTVDMIPAALRPWLSLNPVYYMIVCYQDALMEGIFPRDGALWIFGGIAVVAFTAGYWFFGRMKRVFAENV
jgi:lipopolysaccharide transport system permease protein